ncbi:dUTP diphosphatase [Ruminococcus flavefaciens]|uniref:dUTP diphosphatase n=1 Tax=Ruminococcus flavefaciens 007c TaxID=1341157 RepID=W7UN36_RUMFL|nr:dUTP diphosphatase [Ruminococcus flavefaciens]EWM55193.1 deoxyuridine 5'-triphosphate nucleotidohydrolase [Ruminococcus flavefaciens 007c]
MKLTFKKLDPRAVIPSRATSGSAGLDLCACLDAPVTLAPGEIKMIPIGITAQPDSDDIALLIYPRSGLSSKFGVSLANCVGVVDSDYRGAWFVPLINHGKNDFTVEHGMRIAQMIPTRILMPEIEVSDELSDTQRGEGGFGSSGIR